MDPCESFANFLDSVQRINYARPRHLPIDCAECGKPTSGGKPYCVDHIVKMPIAQKLLDEIREREAELERVARNGPRSVSLEGTRAQEIYEIVKDRKHVTAARIASEVLVPVKLVNLYVKKLIKAQLVKQVEVVERGRIITVIAVIRETLVDADDEDE